MAIPNPANMAIIAAICSASAAGLAAVGAAEANAADYAAYFNSAGASPLSTADFQAIAPDLAAADVAAAMASLTTVATALQASSGASLLALSKVALLGIGARLPQPTRITIPTLTAAQITAGAKPANVRFIANVIGTGIDAVNALRAANQIASQYTLQYTGGAPQLTLATTDFTGVYRAAGLAAADIAAAVAAVSAVWTAMQASSAAAWTALLKLTR